MVVPSNLQVLAPPGRAGLQGGQPSSVSASREGLQVLAPPGRAGLQEGNLQVLALPGRAFKC